MSIEKIRDIFSKLKEKVITHQEAEKQVLDLFHELGSKKVDTSDIVTFAARHQKEYQKDITFSVSKESDTIVVVLHTIFGKFTGKGSNQKIAKVNAVKAAIDVWNG